MRGLIPAELYSPALKGWDTTIKSYTAIVALSCLALCILSILVFENARFDKATKRRFYRTYVFIIITAIAEWAGVFLNGAPKWTTGIHYVVKCADYIFTPVAGACFALQISDGKPSKKYITVAIILIANTVFEILSIFTGWTFYIDAGNYYHHGPLYPVYAVIYCIAIACVFFSFRAYSKKFKRNNKISLYSIIIFVCIGIICQELGGTNVRTASLSLAFASVLLFIHYNEFLQQRNDDDMSRQKTLIETDVLTGMLSRYSYTETLNEYSKTDVLPRDLVVFSIDINGLKNVNDTMGHKAGDELICGAAQCISKVLGKYGKCFRTGGDEFVAILAMDKNQIEETQKLLDTTAEKWQGKIVNSLSFSSGFAISEEHPGISIEKMVNIADKMMYENKALYYQRSGFDRRRNSRANTSKTDT